MFKQLTEEIKKQLQEALGKIDVQAFMQKTAEGDNGTFKVIASNGKIDRDGEIINPDGWELDNYLKNPVILLCHDYWDLPIGIATKVYFDDLKNMVVEGVFAPADANPKAQQVRKLYDLGILKTVSVGFIAKERNGSMIMRQELLEVSFVPVPSNPGAIDIAKANGIEETVIKQFLVEEKSEDAQKDFEKSVIEKLDGILSKFDSLQKEISAISRKGEGGDPLPEEGDERSIPVEVDEEVREFIKDGQKALREVDKIVENLLSKNKEILRSKKQ